MSDTPSLAEQLIELWHRGESPEPTAFLKLVSTYQPSELVEVLLVDQQKRWECGQYRRVEEYLLAFPELRVQPDLLLDLVYGEYLLAEQTGGCPQLEEYVHRFPDLKGNLQIQLELHQALEEKDPLSSMPQLEATPVVGNLDAYRVNRPSEVARLEPVIPGYIILGKLGAGGMGVVYQARQIALKRLVAIKWILDDYGDHDDYNNLSDPANGQKAKKPEQASKDTDLLEPEHLRRFRQEAEAIARLRHPNIVQVHEYGSTQGPRSRPYLVLEYVEGGTLAQKMAGQPQPVAVAARWMETLAQAIEHAHTQGMVHRDLKPANVLLTTEGTLKITDFGLVKLLHSREIHEVHTTTGALVGTPSHMAPEQIGAEFGPIGPRTDVYALGVILYELLTGRLPFQGGILAVLEQIKERTPERPSQWQPSLPRDLETICMKCLEKQPHQRYASAADLAEDLRRFQLQEPIRARPIGSMERVRRWTRRRPAIAGLLVALVVTIGSALTGLTILWQSAEVQRQWAIWEKQEADTQRAEANTQRELATKAAKLADQQRLRAEKQKQEAEANAREAQANLKFARQAIDRYSTLVRTDKRLKELLRPLRKELLQTAIPFYQELIQRSENSSTNSPSNTIEADFGYALMQLGLIQMETESIKSALKYMEQAQVIFARQLSANISKNDSLIQADLAKCEQMLGILYSQMGLPKQAQQSSNAALVRWQSLAGLVKGESKLLRIREEANCLNDLAVLFERQGDVPKALVHLGSCWKLRQQVRTTSPKNVEYHFELGLCQHNLGQVLWKAKKIAEGEKHLNEARKIFQEIRRLQPNLILFEQETARNLTTLASFYLVTKRFAPAIDAVEESTSITRKILERYPEASNVRRLHLGTLVLHGGILNTAGKPNEGKQILEEALREGDFLLQDNADSYEAVILLGPLHINLASSAMRQKNYGKAIDLIDRILPVLEKYLEKDPKSFILNDFVLRGIFNRGLAHNQLGYYVEAIQNYEKALRLDNGTLRNSILYSRAFTLAQTQRHSEGVREAVSLAKTINTGRELYRLASVATLALTTAEKDPRLALRGLKERQNEYTAIALGLLRRANSLGYRDLEQLKNHPDFLGLRQRQEFKELLMEQQDPPEPNNKSAN